MATDDRASSVPGIEFRCDCSTCAQWTRRFEEALLRFSSNLTNVFLKIVLVWVSLLRQGLPSLGSA